MNEMPLCYGHVERRARRAHKCCECTGTIQPGEMYHYHHGVWDVPKEYKVCADCEALREDCDIDVADDERTPFEGLHDSCYAMHVDEPELWRRYVEIGRKRGAEFVARIDMEAATIKARGGK